VDERGSSASADERRVAFDRLAQRRLARAYRLAAAILEDRIDAEDAVHDAVVQAWTDWADLRDPQRFDAWFDRILVHRCQDRLRGRRRTPRWVEPPRCAAAPDELALSPEREALACALSALDADHRTVLVLRFVEDRTVADIAVLTGTREGTVKSRLHYALRQLRAVYEAADRLEAAGR
jgi:RNA polymerase sigma-70 factor, ECF subfamily